MIRTITDAWLRSLKPPKTGRIEVRDQHTRGLILRVTAAGTFSWSVRAVTQDGRKTRVPIGTYPGTGLAAARSRTKVAIGKMQSGADPVGERRAAEAQRKARALLPTVEARLHEWLDAKADKAASTLREYRRLCIVEIIPVLGRKPLSETARADWANMVANVSKRSPSLGSALYRTASSFLGFAEAHGWVATMPLPRKGLQTIAPPVAARERTLTDDEVARVWRTADKLSAKSKVFVRLLVMTGAREMEVADIATGEVDLAGGRWAIPGNRSKNGKGIVLPLHPILVDDLRAVWPEHGDRAGDGWRLLGQIAGNGLRGYSKLKRRVDELSGVDGWRWHDIRRSVRTGLSRLGVPDDIAERCLNHLSHASQLQRIYNRYDFAPEVLAALSRWQAYVADRVADAPLSAEIVSLRRRMPQ